MPAPKPIFEVYQRADGLYDWRAKGKNGEIVATSGGQGFTREADAAAGLLTAADIMEFVPMLEIRYV
jgi:uncharacterized protein YegP (UPF0339 family)